MGMTYQSSLKPSWHQRTPVIKLSMFKYLCNQMYASKMLTQDEDPILGYNAVSLGNWFLMFWRNTLPSSWSDIKIKMMPGPGKKRTYTGTVWQVCGWLQVSAGQSGSCGWDLVSSTLPNPSHTLLLACKHLPCYMYCCMWNRSEPDALRISCWFTRQWTIDPKDMTWCCNSWGSTSMKSSTISHRDHSWFCVDFFFFRPISLVQNQTNTIPKS